jgi:L-alanine-DL-glutamate epimerase-like enolase superfamily enzyme
MKITCHETWAVRVPYEKGRAAAIHLVLRLNTDDGAQGISYGTAIVPWTVRPLQAAIDALMEKVVSQDPMAVERINAALLARISRPQFDGLARSAVSIIDMALWDLKAKALSRPLFRLLGATNPQVPIYAAWNLFPTSASPDLEALTASAREHVARGFRAMKFHVPRIPGRADVVACARALREAVGDDIDLYVDMNWSRTIKEAIALGHELAPYRLSWIEDPIPANDYDGLRRITEALETPICAGETYSQAGEFRSLFDRHGVDVVVIDFEVGGITQWLQIAQMAETYRIPVTSHVHTEVSAHAMAAVNGLVTTYLPWAQPLFKEPMTVRQGALVLSERPGLGLELDPAALTRFAL